MNKNDSRIIPIVQRFKSYTAHVVNKVLQRSGSFWAREYYDHLIRDSEQFGRLVRYTLDNPVKAKLCKHWAEWKGTICSESIKRSILPRNWINMLAPARIGNLFITSYLAPASRRRYKTNCNGGNMLRTFAAIVVFLISLVLADYASSAKMKSSWKNPSATASSLQFKNVLVLAAINQDFTRKIAEDRAVQIIESGGAAKAEASYTIIGAEEFNDKERLIGACWKNIETSIDS
jgi:hypothetical protein